MAAEKAEEAATAGAPPEAAPAALQPIDVEQASPWLKRIFLLHVSKIIEVAARNKRLSIDDCWRHGETPQEALERFDAAYEEEQRRPKPSLKRVFWKLSKADFLRSGVCFGTAQVLQLASPLFLNRIVRIVEVFAKYGRGDECRDLADEVDRPLCDTHGLVLVPVLFTVIMFLQSVLNAQAQLLSLRLALRFQKMTIAAIFRKSIKLSSIGAGSASSGGIGNLVSNDAQQIMQAAPMMHWLWMAPLAVLVSFMLLGLSVGPSLFVGFAVILVCLPVIFLCLVKAFQQRKFMVKATDERVKLISDVLTGVRVIKAYGWEKAIMDKVSVTRKEELRFNTKRGVWMSVLICFMFLVPVFNAIGILSVFAATGNEFTASRVFMALATLNNMRFPIILGPFLVFQFQNFSLALTRMGAFLALDELPPAVLDRPCAPAFAGGSTEPPPSVSELLNSPPVFADGVNAAWAVPDPPADDKGKGKGKRGCPCLGKRRGKGGDSQEADEPHGRPPAAEPEEGNPADQQGKNIVTVQKGGAEVKLTQVLSDIKFEATPGRLTGVFGQVGSGKSSLLQCLLGEMESLGGTAGIHGTVAYAAQQAMIFNATVRQNITLAKDFVIPPHMQETYDEVVRACQLQDDLDLFPAGDLTEIGERGVNLSGGQKQRISLARAAYSGAEVVLLDDPLSAVDAHVGRALFDQLISDQGLLKDKTRVFVTHQLQYLQGCALCYAIDQGRVKSSGTHAELVAAGVLEPPEEDKNQECAGRPPSKSPGTVAARPSQCSTTKASRLVMEEEREEGELRMEVLAYYVRAGGYTVCALWLLMVAACVSSDLSTQSWVAAWASGSGMGTQEGDNHTVDFYIAIYVLLAFAQGLFLLGRNVTLVVVHQRRSSHFLHSEMMHSVFRAKILFFDKNPIGRVLNRFTRDMEYIDMQLVQNINQFTNTFGGTCGALVMMCVIYPYIIIVAVVMAAVYYRFTKYYRYASREAQRLEAITRSPIFALLTESQSGVVTIRGYGIGHIILRMADTALDTNVSVNFIIASCIAWLQMRLDFIATAILMCVMAIPAASPGSVEPGYAGLALVYAFELSNLMKWSARMGAEVEQKMNAVDRTLDYTMNIEKESPWELPGDKALDPEWPTAGTLKFENVTMRYREGLEPALQGVNFELNGGEKIGVCGRTGSGKSSLIVCVLRITEFTGRVMIDGVDIKDLGLHRLRHGISMIPQDPVLFCATLRSNLDPLGLAESDDRLLSTLELVHLRAEVEALGGLDYRIAEGGTNLSVGQRQLVCLARSVLRRSRLVLLDEATASIDHETDQIIQTTIRAEFKGSTVFTIAHRINTILDSDRVLVMKDGHVGELGTPQELARDRGSHFRGLLVSSNQFEFLEKAEASP